MRAMKQKTSHLDDFAEFERKNVSIVLLGDKSDRVADELIENMVGGPGKS